jgi:quinolinate synthase
MFRKYDLISLLLQREKYGMKRNTLHDIFFSLKEERYEIILPEHIRIKAKESLDKML